MGYFFRFMPAHPILTIFISWADHLANKSYDFIVDRIVEITNKTSNCWNKTKTWLLANHQQKQQQQYQMLFATATYIDTNMPTYWQYLCSWSSYPYNRVTLNKILRLLWNNFKWLTIAMTGWTSGTVHAPKERKKERKTCNKARKILFFVSPPEGELF